MLGKTEVILYSGLFLDHCLTCVIGKGIASCILFISFHCLLYSRAYVILISKHALCVLVVLLLFLVVEMDYCVTFITLCIGT